MTFRRFKEGTGELFDILRYPGRIYDITSPLWLITDDAPFDIALLRSFNM
jgi:hypothetical protein